MISPPGRCTAKTARRAIRPPHGSDPAPAETITRNMTDCPEVCVDTRLQALRDEHHRSRLSRLARWSAARRIRISSIFLSAFLAEGSGARRPKSAIGALMKLQSGGILSLGSRESAQSTLAKDTEPVTSSSSRKRSVASGHRRRQGPCRPRPFRSGPSTGATPTPIRPRRSGGTTRRNVAAECKPAQHHEVRFPSNRQLTALIPPRSPAPDSEAVAGEDSPLSRIEHGSNTHREWTWLRSMGSQEIGRTDPTATTAKPESIIPHMTDQPHR